jgi:hypothetical protein
VGGPLVGEPLEPLAVTRENAPNGPPEAQVGLGEPLVNQPPTHSDEPPDLDPDGFVADLAADDPRLDAWEPDDAPLRDEPPWDDEEEGPPGYLADIGEFPGRPFGRYSAARPCTDCGGPALDISQLCPACIAERRAAHRVGAPR